MPVQNGVLSGSFTATGLSDPISITGPFSLSLSFGVGTVALERFDSANDQWVTESTYTDSTAKAGDEPEHGIKYRLNCSAYTSGTIYYRLAQGTNSLAA